MLPNSTEGDIQVSAKSGLTVVSNYYININNLIL